VQQALRHPTETVEGSPGLIVFENVEKKSAERESATLF
jgi:hypothetical protein